MPIAIRMTTVERVIIAVMVGLLIGTTVTGILAHFLP
jgi:hypothetical protein